VLEDCWWIPIIEAAISAKRHSLKSFHRSLNVASLQSRYASTDIFEVSTSVSMINAKLQQGTCCWKLNVNVNISHRLGH